MMQEIMRYLGDGKYINKVKKKFGERNRRDTIPSTAQQ